jgi:hypothetical protein
MHMTRPLSTGIRCSTISWPSWVVVTGGLALIESAQSALLRFWYVQ